MVNLINFDTYGNVGIGIQPQVRLHIVANGTNNSFIYNDASGSQYSGVSLFQIKMLGIG